MEKKELEKKASDMMRLHSLEEVYVTSDGQGFTEAERAYDRARYLSDKKVLHFRKETKVDDTEETDELDTETDDIRLKLAIRYEELFDKKPTHNIGIEKLQERITEKEAELVKIDTPVIEEVLDTEEQGAEQEGTEKGVETEQPQEDLKKD